jgi:hypothetical protein
MLTIAPDHANLGREGRGGMTFLGNGEVFTIVLADLSLRLHSREEEHAALVKT